MQLPHLKGHILEKLDFKQRLEPIIPKTATYIGTGRVSYQPPWEGKYRKKLALECFSWEHRDYCENGNLHIAYLGNKNDGGYDGKVFHCLKKT